MEPVEIYDATKGEPNKFEDAFVLYDAYDEP